MPKSVLRHQSIDRAHYTAAPAVHCKNPQFLSTLSCGLGTADRPEPLISASPLRLCELRSWCGVSHKCWHFRRKMSVSALIKASRSSETFPENLYCNAELRGAAVSVVRARSVSLMSLRSLLFSESILWVLIRNPVLIRRLRTWWHLDDISKGWGTPRPSSSSPMSSTPQMSSPSRAWKNVRRIKWRVPLCQLFVTLSLLFKGSIKHESSQNSDCLVMVLIYFRCNMQ